MVLSFVLSMAMLVSLFLSVEAQSLVVICTIFAAMASAESTTPKKR